MIQFTLEQLMSFSIVAEQGSFSKATRVIFKDRTTISEHVSNLEIALDTELFTRSGNKLTITKEGEILLRWARSLVKQAHGFQMVSDSLSLHEQHHFRIGIDMNICNEFIVDVSAALKEKYPCATVDWIYRNRQEALNEVNEKSLDAALILKNDRANNLLPPAGLTACYLGEIKGKIFTAVDSPLQDLVSINFEDLLDSTRYVLQSFYESGIGERASYSGRQVVLNGIDLVVKFIETDGWAYLPSINTVENNPNIKTLNVDFLNQHWSTGLALVSRRDISGDIYQCLLKRIKDLFHASFSS